MAIVETDIFSGTAKIILYIGGLYILWSVLKSWNVVQSPPAPTVSDISYDISDWKPLTILNNEYIRFEEKYG